MEELFKPTITNGTLDTVDLGGAATSVAGTYTITFTAVGSEVSDTAVATAELTIEEEVVVPVITADATATTPNGTALSDVELITLFNASVTEGATLMVNQSAVDYNTAGDYDVVFSAEGATNKTSKLTVEEPIPVVPEGTIGEIVMTDTTMTMPYELTVKGDAGVRLILKEGETEIDNTLVNTVGAGTYLVESLTPETTYTFKISNAVGGIQMYTADVTTLATADGEVKATSKKTTKAKK